MASRTSFALLVLALFGAALFLQAALADDVVSGGSKGDVVAVSAKANIDSDTASSEIDHDTAEDVEDDQVPGIADERISEEEEELGEIQPYVYVPEADEVEAAADEEDQQGASVSEVRSLARILHERSSTKCWSKEKCLKLYKQAGCCKNKCFNLSTSNMHCGKCKKYCDTRKGYFCQSGKCRKRHSRKSCYKTKDCKGENSCCKGKCVNLEQDCKNCGECGNKCPWGSACCHGYCKHLKTDGKNCGKCGRKCPKGNVCCDGKCVYLKKSSSHCGKCGKHCGWGRKCCHGKCVSVTSDKENCGRCGKECSRGVKCTFGICGYGQ